MQLRPVVQQLQSQPLASLAQLAEMAGMSRYQLIRAFRAATGMTPHAYQLNLGVNRARSDLQAGNALADIACALGFADQSHLQRVFKAHVGITPGRYRG
ncbi:helix-turn-helix transcriptional regulator [Janthinobacterium agaricidamnosum]|uniref:helix-turn-helix transcriptional regulator n=1 Tax=Janthinobacterium agaricidamnosum TaxID=55508 RepID=UPI001F097FCD|nr:helix-turn-helix transcriptional regulator [Janthinobacterium agaricidamnosum]